MTGDGLDLLKPFLPGLEAALDDPDVSEIMINGPGNVWLEGHGRLRPIRRARARRGGAGAGGDPYRPAVGPGPGDDADPRCAPRRRLARGHLRPAGQPVRRHHRPALWQTILFGGAAGRTRRAARAHPRRGRAGVAHPPEYPRERRHRERQDDAAQRAHCPHPRRRADRRHRGHLGAPHRLPELRPVRGARAAHREPSRSATSCATPCGTDPITSSSAKCAAARPPTCCKPSTPDTAARSPPSTPTTRRAPSHDVASCAMQGGGDLPWDVTCRGVVDGIALVIHMTRRDGRRFVEEAAVVNGYDAGTNTWDIHRLDRVTI